MARSALPQYYKRSEGFVFEDFQTLSQYVKNGAGTIEADTTNYKLGVQGMKLTTSDSSVGVFGAKDLVNNDMSYKSKRLVMWVYIHDDPANLKSIVLYLSSETIFSNKYFTYVLYGEFFTRPGWHQIAITDSEWTTDNGESFANPMKWLRVRIYSKAGKTASVTFGGIYYDVDSIPTCLLTFDDGNAQSYDAYAAMKTKGILGTFFVSRDLVGTTNFMTLEQLQTIYADGFALGNHTTTHTDLTSLSKEECVKRIQENHDWLMAQGMPRAAKFLAYPESKYNSTVMEAVSQCDVLAARNGKGYGTGYIYPLAHDLRNFCCRSINRDTTLATAKGYVDYALKYCCTVIILLHGVRDVPGPQDMSTANFNALLDYIKQKQIRTQTIDEFYHGLTNPRYRSIPLSRATV